MKDYEKSQYKAYGYLRLSQEDSGNEESNSITNQRNIIESFTRQHPDLDLKGFEIDDGFSGVTFDRPGFQKLMQLIECGDCDCIIVKDLSRFGRNYIGSGNFIERVFPELGVRFIAINDDYDSLHNVKGSDRIILPFRNLVNDMYSRDISTKVRSSLDASRKSGKFVGSFTTYGYKKDDNDPNRLIVDKRSAKIVKRIFEWKLNGMSNLAIADRLNEMGESSPLGYKQKSGLKYQTSFQGSGEASWSSQAVGRILANEVYLGNMEQKKETTISYKSSKRISIPKEDWIRVEGTHAPIIDAGLFHAVQKLLEEKPARKAKSLDNDTYLFSGKVFCRICGSLLCGQTISAKNKKYTYYYCPVCQKTSANRIRGEVLYQLVFEKLSSYIANVDRMLQEINRFGIDIFLKDEKQRVEMELKIKRDEQIKCDSIMQVLHSDYKEGILNAQEEREYQARYAEQSKELINKIKELEIAQRRLTLGEYKFDFSWMESVLSFRGFEDLTRRMLNLLIKAVQLSPSHDIQISYRHEQQYEKIAEVLYKNIKSRRD